MGGLGTAKASRMTKIQLSLQSSTRLRYQVRKYKGPTTDLEKRLYSLLSYTAAKFNLTHTFATTPEKRFNSLASTGNSR